MDKAITMADYRLGALLPFHWTGDKWHVEMTPTAEKSWQQSAC